MDSVRGVSLYDSFNDLKSASSELSIDKLTELKSEIWKNGLNEEHFSTLLEKFIKNKNLNLNQRKVILECMIPRFIVDDDRVEKILLWFLSNYISDPDSSACLLKWLGNLIEHKLMNTSKLEFFYSQLVLCFQAEVLVKPLSYLLELLSSAKTVNSETAFLIGEYYEDFNQNADLKNLLWIMKKYRPHDIKVEFKTQPRKIKKKSDFEKIVAMIARKQGISVSDTSINKIVPGTFPEPEYSGENSNTTKMLTDITSARELGRSIGELSIALPDNITSLIGSEMGQLYLEVVGPTEEFMLGLQGLIESHPSPLIVSSLSELQYRLRRGLPIITQYLANYLITWDGVESEQLVFDLIKWAHFNNFSDLSSMILVPLTRLYVCCPVEMKLAIINTLITLLINMISIHMERDHQENTRLYETIERQSWLDNPMVVINEICNFMQSLIRTGLLLEGVNSASIILIATKFYDTMITLQLEYSLVCLIPPLENVMYATLVSVNSAVLSQAGSLLVRYNKNVFPYLNSLGLQEEFSDNIEVIKRISENMYGYLWLGKEISEENESAMVDQNDRSHTEKLRKHPAIFPLLEFLATNLKMDLKKLKKSDILLMLVSYCEGLGEFITYCETVYNV